MSKYKAPTANIQPLSSGANTGELGQLSEPLAVPTTVADSTPSMPITKLPSPPIYNSALDEKIRLNAMILRAAIGVLRKYGLIKQYRVLSIDRTTVIETRLVFKSALWTDRLELQLLSDGTPVALTVIDKSEKK